MAAKILTTKKEIKEKAQDLIMQQIQNVLFDDENKIDVCVKKEIVKQVHRIEKLFDYDIGSWGIVHK